jgi:hypothetical protein
MRRELSAFFIFPLLLSGVATAQSAGGFTATGGMITPRYAHTAILLPNDKVLIAGGVTVYYFASGCILASSAEPYVTGAFTATGSMPTISPRGGVSFRPSSRISRRLPSELPRADRRRDEICGSESIDLHRPLE